MKLRPSPEPYTKWMEDSVFDKRNVQGCGFSFVMIPCNENELPPVTPHQFPIFHPVHIEPQSSANSVHLQLPRRPPYPNRDRS